MPLKIKKPNGSIETIPLYASKTAGSYQNGSKFLGVRKGGVTRYVHLYPIGHARAIYGLYVRIDGVTYRAGYAVDILTHRLDTETTWYVPSDAIWAEISNLQLIGGGGAGGVQGSNYAYSAPTGGSIGWYGGGGGGGQHGLPKNIKAVQVSPGDRFDLIFGAGGQRGVSNGGETKLLRNNGNFYTAAGGQNGWDGGNASNGSHGSGGQGGGYGSGWYPGANGAPGTSAGKGANGAGAAVNLTDVVGRDEIDNYGASWYGNGGTGSINGLPGRGYAVFTYLRRATSY